MCDWEGVKRLGAYLGIGDVHEEPPGTIEIICHSLRAFEKRDPHETSARLADIIFQTDFSRLSRNGDRENALARDVFDRLHPNAAGEEAFLEFNADFRHFVRWFRAALDAVLHVHGMKKEPIRLDRPGIREYIAELKELPCRRLGELNFSHRMHGYAAISRYIEALLVRYEGDPVSKENCRSIIEIMGKVAGHPGYFRSMSPEQKLIETRPLLMAISELQLDPGNEPGKADMISVLAILLFNVFPAPNLLKFITRLPPSPYNEALQYDHSAILAMNFMLSGSLAEAEAYNKKAREYAGDEEKRAYTYILESCISLSRGKAEEAIGALRRCRALTKDGRIKAITHFYAGIIQYEAGNISDAIESFRISKAGLEDELDIMCVCNNIGTCAMLLGDLEAAAGELENVEYVGLYMTSNSARALKTVACSSLGLIYMSMENYDRAMGFFKETLKLNREAHNKKGLADQLGNIGLALKAKGDFRAALGYFKSALNAAFVDDYLEGALFAFAQVEQLMALDGRYEDAEAFKQEMIRRNPGIAKMLRR